MLLSTIFETNDLGFIPEPILEDLGKLTIEDLNGKIAEQKQYENIDLPAGRTVTELPSFKPEALQGYYVIRYKLSEF